VVNAEPTAAVRTRAGSALPALITAALLVVLAGGAGYLAWQRRQAG
jgi:uncharacterized protein HemX